jgi:hypothetical protein
MTPWGCRWAQETFGQREWHGQETVPQRVWSYRWAQETFGQREWHGQETVPQRDRATTRGSAARTTETPYGSIFGGAGVGGW